MSCEATRREGYLHIVATRVGINIEDLAGEVQALDLQRLHRILIHLIARNATVSGAEGGCQAECGSAAAMTAAALVELAGGTPEMASAACGLALMNSMGLVCDPVAGLVEVPCVYRNVGSVANALTAADMAMAGIAAPIPTDEIIDAMKSVGDMLPACLRETGEGGVAACPSALKAKKI